MRYSILAICICIISGCKFFSTSDSKAKTETQAAGAIDPDEPFSIPNADERPAKCDSDAIKQIDAMPLDHANQGAGIFPYRYEHIINKKDATTVIYLPGGPGGSSIGVGGGHEKALRDMNLIRIDPRGVACNHQSGKGFRLRELTTWQHIRDVLAVIQHSNVKDFIIYGSSYGTLAGTILAVEAEKASIRPKAVVLEGVIGKAFTNGVRQAFDVEYDALRKDFDEARQILDGELPLGLSEKEWGEAINTSLTYSRFEAAKLLRYGQSAQGTESEEEAREYIRQLLASDLVLGQTTIYAAVTCSEIQGPKDPLTFELRDRRMEAVPITDQCTGITPRAFYDPSAFPIKSPIYYFQGDHDPATPLEQARHHYHSQSGSTKRIWVTAKDGGHAPTWAADQLGACADKIWQRIDELKDLDGVVTAEGECAWNDSLAETDLNGSDGAGGSDGGDGASLTEIIATKRLVAPEIIRAVNQ